MGTVVLKNFSSALPTEHNLSERSESELQRCKASTILLWAYQWATSLGLYRATQAVLRIALRLEGGEIFSFTARQIMRQHHKIEIGSYSYGCFDSVRFPDGARIGRYVSIARSVRSYRRNHPTNRLSTHPFLFSDKYSSLQNSNVSTQDLVIDHDVWIGAHTVILPGCQHIGIGAIVGAGSVVTKNVDPYTIVAGNPARLIRHRFEPDVATRITESCWWEHSQDTLQKNVVNYEKHLLSETR